jgi:membrane associated rhomboid family serine protease
MFYFFYYFPLGFDVRARRRAWATWGLVGATLLGFALARLFPAWIWEQYESLVYVPDFPRASALLLNAYLHADWLHWISNMISLVVFGPALEDRLGARRFLLLYHACNVCGNLVQGAMAHALLPGTSGYGILGASGAISGLVGLFVVRLYFARLRVAYWAFMPLQAYTRAGSRQISVGAAVFLWLLMQLAVVLTQTQGAAVQVAAGSHLGGLAAGVGFALTLGLRRQAMAEQHLHRGRSYLARAQWYAAQGELIAYVRRRPGDPEGRLELARTYRLTDDHNLADEQYRVACEQLARGRRIDRVEQIMREAERGRPDFVLRAGLQLRVAQLLERALKPDAAEQAYTSYWRRYPSASGVPVALYRASRLAQRRGAHQLAAELLNRLRLQHPDALETELACVIPGGAPTSQSRGGRTPRRRAPLQSERRGRAAHGARAQPWSLARVKRRR